MSDSQNVLVVCRVRPSNKIEARNKGSNCVSTTETTVKIGLEEPHTFTFDRCFGAIAHCVATSQTNGRNADVVWTA